MRLVEQQQRRVQRDIEARERIEAMREAQRMRRAEAAELISMRREEECVALRSRVDRQVAARQ